MIRDRFPTRVGNFSLHHRVQTASGTHPATYSMGTGGGGSLPEGKRPGRVADHSSPPRAEVKECVELYLCALTKHHAMKAYWVSGDTAPRIL
jgi:hypothetical protein